MASRAANGEGTIYRRKDGRYEAAAYFLTTSGARKRVRVYGRTRQEVHDKLIEAKGLARQGIPVHDKNWRVGDYLDYWLGHVVQATRRPATYDQCERMVRLYLKPSLGDLPMSRLSVPVVQEFLNQKLAEGYSIPNVQVMRKVLSSALTCALREELVSRNVARLVVLPTHQPVEIKPWTADEAKQFLTASRTSPLYPAFLLLLLYGLRRGEVLGLSWQDVDFAEGTVHVRQQLQRVDHSLQLGPLKTRAGRRDLPLLHMVRDTLTAHLRSQIRAQLTGDSEWRGDPVESIRLVFVAQNGHPMEPSALRRSFRRICRQNSIRLIRVHDLRHTAATLLKNLKVPARDAQLILGHAKITTTLQIYQHDDMSSRLEALEKVESLFLRTVGGVGMRSRQVSRQVSRQAGSFVAAITSIISGAGEETLTLGLILGKSPSLTIRERATEVNRAVNERRRQWLVGIVAVNLAVNDTS